jgi:ornithine cyclodeaminase/alanine dehydrogenase-like protein (mu-crystallin family)
MFHNYKNININAKKSSCIEFLYLSQEEVIDAGGLDMRIAIDAIERAFHLLDQGQIVIPSKIVMELPPSERDRGRMNGLAAYIGGDWEVAGIKWIPSFPNNPDKYHLPRANGLIILSDTRTGMPLAIMDGTLISAVRTGAIGGIGAKYLAKKGSEVVGLIGMGVQARTQAMALKEALPNLKEIRGYRRNQEKILKDVKEIEQLTGVKTRNVQSPKEAVEGADVIVTSTTANEPIVKASWLKKGVLFIHVGSYIEEEFAVVLKSDKIIVDDWEVVKHRGTPILAKMFSQGLIRDENIYANLVEIVTGKKPGRQNNKEGIFFAPIGMAHEDIAFASEIYERAVKKGIGKTLRLWNEPLWVS